MGRLYELYVDMQRPLNCRQLVVMSKMSQIYRLQSLSRIFAAMWFELQYPLGYYFGSLMYESLNLCHHTNRMYADVFMQVFQKTFHKLVNCISEKSKEHTRDRIRCKYFLHLSMRCGT